MWVLIIVLYASLFNIGKTNSNIEKNNKKSNVLIIFIDDMRKLSDEEFYLPNIQNLAAKGISFTNAFAQVKILKLTFY